MRKKDKIAILYSTILCILFTIRVNTDKLDAYDDYILILLLFMIWDLFFRPRKYEITLTYLANSYINSEVDIYCIYDSQHMVKDVYCKVDNDNLLDGYRRLNPILGFSNTTSLASFKNYAKNITNVEHLIKFMAKNYNISIKAKEYNYYKSNSNLLTWGSFAAIVIFSFLYCYLNNRTF